MISKQFKAMATILGTLCAAASLQADIVVSTETERPEAPAEIGTPYNPTFVAGGPSSTDLLNGIEGVNTSADPEANFNFEAGAGLPGLTDGSVETVYGGGNSATNPREAYATAGTGGNRNAGTQADWDLGGSFNITEINVFGGWVDGGRDEQNFTILVSTDGGTTFTPIVPDVGAVDANESGNGDTSLGGRSPISHRTSFIEDGLNGGSGFLAVGVTNIRFDWTAPVENGQTGYTEIDVIGTPVNSVLLGDVDMSGTVDFSDISPFIALLSSGTFQAEADCDESGAVDFSDIAPFIAILSGS